MQHISNSGSSQFHRISGIAALGFAGAIVGMNLIMVPAGLPSVGAPDAEVVAWFGGHRDVVGIASVLGPAAWVLATLFGAGAVSVMWRGAGAGRSLVARRAPRRHPAERGVHRRHGHPARSCRDRRTARRVGPGSLGAARCSVRAQRDLPRAGARRTVCQRPAIGADRPLARRSRTRRRRSSAHLGQPRVVGRRRRAPWPDRPGGVADLGGLDRRLRDRPDPDRKGRRRLAPLSIHRLPPRADTRAPG